MTWYAGLAKFTCEVDEEISTIKSLSNSGIPTSAAFCAGTLRTQLGEGEPSLGRLLLFGIDGSGDSVQLTAAEETDGCVFAIATMNGMIIAAVNASVRSN